MIENAPLITPLSHITILAIFRGSGRIRAVLMLNPDDTDARYNYELALRLALPPTPSEQQQQTEPELGETDPTVTPSPEPGGFEGPTPTPPREEFEPDFTETPVGGTGDFGDDAQSTPVPVDNGPMTLEQAMRLLDAARRMRWRSRLLRDSLCGRHDRRERLVRRALLLFLFSVLVLQAGAQEAAPYLADASFDSEWAYIGQAVTYTVTAYSDTARDVTFRMPVFEGFWQADVRVFAGSATLDGKQYNTAVYQVRLYPQQVGRLELGAAQVEFEETVFSAGAIRLSSAASIEVMELPPEPDGFSGMVGAVAAEFSADLSVVRLGEPVTVA